jgi:hypothetical protein
MKIGLELIAAVTSQVRAALLKIKNALTGAYLGIKQKVSAFLKELRLRLKRSAAALLGKK